MLATILNVLGPALFLLIGIVLTNLAFVHITDAARWTWLLPLVVLTVASPLLDGLRRYVRYHVEDILYGEFPFDVLTSFGYRDKASTDRVFANLGGDAGKPLLEDEVPATGDHPDRLGQGLAVGLDREVPESLPSL